PDGGVFQLPPPAPLVAVAQRRAGEADEPPVGDVEDVGPIDAAAAGRRGVREPLPPAAGVEVVGEEREPLRDAVVAAEVNPLAVVRVVVARAFPAERRRRGARARTLLDPPVLRVGGPVGLLLRR